MFGFVILVKNKPKQSQLSCTVKKSFDRFIVVKLTPAGQDKASEESSLRIPVLNYSRVRSS